MDKVQVGVRLRPLIEREKSSEIFWTVGENCLYTTPSSPYKFDVVFGQTNDNQDVYSKLGNPIVHAAMKGFHGTIFAYGQTASGKTFTMEGTDESPGFIPSAIRDIFQTIENTPDREFLIRVSYLEIYNENVVDLLSGSRKSLEVREDMEKNVYVAHLKEEIVTNAQELFIHFRKGQVHRHSASTNMNERSSRSHTIFRVIIESRERLEDPGEAADGAVMVSHLNLVDLAGSEKAKQTGATGQRLTEGAHINKSLSILCHVISQLSENAAYISYRDSKLTRILQNSLGGNSKTVIICNASPASLEETHSTLRFATSAKKIKNKPIQNEVLTEQAMLKKYRRQISHLEKTLDELRQTDVHKLHQKLAEKEQKEVDMQNKYDNLTKLICVSSRTKHLSTKQKMKRRETWCPGLAPTMHVSSPMVSKEDPGIMRTTSWTGLAAPSTKFSPLANPVFEADEGAEAVLEEEAKSPVEKGESVCTAYEQKIKDLEERLEEVQRNSDEMMKQKAEELREANCKLQQMEASHAEQLLQLQSQAQVEEETYKQNIKDLEDRLKDQENDGRQNREKTQHLQTALEEEKQQNRVFAEKIQELEATLEKEREQGEVFTKEIQQLEAQTERETDDSDSHHARIAELEATIAKGRLLVEEYKEQISQLEEEAHVQQMESDELKAAYEEEANRNKELEAAANNPDVLVKMQEELEEVQRNSDEMMKQKAEELREVNCKLQQMEASHAKQLLQLQSQASAQVDEETYKQNIKDLEDRLQLETTEKLSLQDIIQKLEDDQEIDGRQNREKMQKLKTALEEEKQQNGVFAEKIQELEVTLEKEREQGEVFTKKIQQLEAQTERETDDSDSHHARIAELEATIAKGRLLVEEYKEQISQLEEAAHVQQMESDELKAAYEEEANRNKELEAAANNPDVLVKMQEELEEVQRNSDEMMKQKAEELREVNCKLQQMEASHAKQLLQLQSQTSAQVDEETYKQNIKDLEDRLQLETTEKLSLQDIIQKLEDDQEIDGRQNREKMQKLKTALEEEKQQNGVFAEKVQELEATLEKEREQGEVFTKKIQQLEAQTERETDDSDSHQARIAELEATIAKGRLLVEEYKEQISQLEEEAHVQQMESDELKAAYEEAASRNKELEAAANNPDVLVKMQEELEEVQRNSDEMMKQKAEELREVNCKLQQMEASHAKQLLQLQSQMKSAEIEPLIRENDELKLKCHQLEEKLKASNSGDPSSISSSEVKKLQNTVKLHQMNHEEDVLEIQKLEATIDGMDKEIEDVKKENERLEKQCQQLDDKLKTSKSSSILESSTEVKKLQEKIKLIESDHEENVEEIRRLEKTIDEVDNELEAAKKENTTLKSKCQQLEVKLKTSKSSDTGTLSSTEELKELQDKVKFHEWNHMKNFEEIKRLEGTIDEVNKELETAKKENTQLKTQCQQLEKKLETLEATLEAADQDWDTLLGSSGASKDKLRLLQSLVFEEIKTIKKLEEENKTSRINLDTVTDERDALKFRHEEESKLSQLNVKLLEQAEEDLKNIYEVNLEKKPDYLRQTDEIYERGRQEVIKGLKGHNHELVLKEIEWESKVRQMLRERKNWNNDSWAIKETMMICIKHLEKESLANDARKTLVTYLNEAVADKLKFEPPIPLTPFDRYSRFCYEPGDSPDREDIEPEHFHIIVKKYGRQVKGLQIKLREIEAPLDAEKSRLQEDNSHFKQRYHQLLDKVEELKRLLTKSRRELEHHKRQDRDLLLIESEYAKRERRELEDENNSLRKQVEEITSKMDN